MNDISPTQVATEISDALRVDALTELTDAIPSGTPTFMSAAMFHYMAGRNKTTTSGSVMTVFNDAGSAVFRLGVADDDTTFTKDEAIAGT